MASFVEKFLMRQEGITKLEAKEEESPVSFLERQSRGNGLCQLIAFKEHKLFKDELSILFYTKNYFPQNSLNNALVEAAKQGNRMAIEGLLLFGANPNYTDIKGQVPLSVCLRYKRVNVLELLLQNGASMDSIKTKRDDSALTFAIRVNCNVEIVDILLRYGADPLWVCSDSKTPINLCKNETIKKHLVDFVLKDSLKSWGKSKDNAASNCETQKDKGQQNRNSLSAVKDKVCPESNDTVLANHKTTTDNHIDNQSLFFKNDSRSHSTHNTKNDVLNLSELITETNLDTNSSDNVNSLITNSNFKAKMEKETCKSGHISLKDNTNVHNGVRLENGHIESAQINEHSENKGENTEERKTQFFKLDNHINDTFRITNQEETLMEMEDVNMTLDSGSDMETGSNDFNESVMEIELSDIESEMDSESFSCPDTSSSSGISSSSGGSSSSLNESGKIAFFTSDEDEEIREYKNTKRYGIDSGTEGDDESSETH